jgi:hypothetical protein
MPGKRKGTDSEEEQEEEEEQSRSIAIDLSRPEKKRPAPGRRTFKLIAQPELWELSRMEGVHFIISILKNIYLNHHIALIFMFSNYSIVVHIYLFSNFVFFGVLFIPVGTTIVVAPVQVPTMQDLQLAVAANAPLPGAGMIGVIQAAVQAAVQAGIAPLAAQITAVQAGIAPLAAQITAPLAAQITAVQAGIAPLAAQITALQATVAPLPALIARAHNASNNSATDPLMPVPHNGNNPAWFPPTRSSMNTITVARINTLLIFYGLPQNGNTNAKKLRLKRHFGLRE